MISLFAPGIIWVHYVHLVLRQHESFPIFQDIMNAWLQGRPTYSNCYQTCTYLLFYKKVLEWHDIDPVLFCYHQYDMFQYYNYIYELMFHVCKITHFIVVVPYSRLRPTRR